MRVDPHHLDTLVAIVEEGSFEAAARRLQVTPSAVSQRMRALERAVGTVVVRRTSPARVTSAGEPLLRFGRQLRLLTAEVAAELTGSEAIELSIAVNADSLATWFRPVLASVAARSGTALRLHVEDQAHSHRLLRNGEALAAITDMPDPVQGCAVNRLGKQRYLAAAAPTLLAPRWRDGHVDWATLPMVVFNEKDRLQDEVLATQGKARPTVVHRVPTTADFLAAVEAGLGWGMLPESQVQDAVSRDSIVPIPGVRPVDVTLYWQRWRLASEALSRLDDDVREAAGALQP